MQEAPYFRGAATLQQTPRSFNVGAHERGRIVNTAVDMAFRGKMDHCVATFGGFGNFRIANVHAEELHAADLQNSFKVFQVSRVSKLVKDHQLIGWVIAQHSVNKIRAYESRSSGHQDLHSRSAPLEANAAPSVDAAFSLNSRTRLLARQSDSNVPASVHQPSSVSWVMVPSAR